MIDCKEVIIKCIDDAGQSTQLHLDALSYEKRLSYDSEGRTYVAWNGTQLMIHSDDGPAISGPDKDIEFWYKKGFIYRNSGPAVTLVLKNGGETLKIKRWYSTNVNESNSPTSEFVEDIYGNVISKSIFDGKFKYMDVDFEQLKGDAKMSKRKQLPQIDLMTANREKMNIVRCIDKDGEVRTLACEDGAISEDLYFIGDKGYLDGTKYADDNSTFLNAQLLLHSPNDLPAFIKSNGDKHWFDNGLRHRIGGPAIEKANGNKYWMQEGMLHREDGAAFERPDGKNEFWAFGVPQGSLVPESTSPKFYVWVHIKDENAKTKKVYFFSEADYKKCLFTDENECKKIVLNPLVNAVLHNPDGPAVEYLDGRTEHFIDGKKSLSCVTLHLENQKPIEINKTSDLWDKYLMLDSADGKVKLRSTGEIVSNARYPAIIYKDDCRAHIINGRFVSPIFSQVSIGGGYEVDYCRDWTIKGFNLTATHADAILHMSNIEPFWRITVRFEDDVGPVVFDLFHSDLGNSCVELASIMKRTDLKSKDVFLTGQFIHDLLCTIIEEGPNFTSDQQINNNLKSQLQNHIISNEKDVADFGMGLPLAFLALAGLSGIIKNNKAKKKLKRIQVSIPGEQKHIEENLPVVVEK